MSQLQILKYPHKWLREKACLVAFPLSAEQRFFIQELVATMWQADGAGLGANQVGRSEAIFVLATRKDDEKKATVFINPTITERSEESEKAIEGCLSLPGVNAKVRRHNEVTVRAQDEEGNWFECQGDASDYMSRALQHEMDHLEGKLYIDRISYTERSMLLNKFRKSQKRAAEYQKRVAKAVAEFKRRAVVEPLADSEETNNDAGSPSSSSTGAP
jgi:peptide deformylase